jgi:acyl-coenzyme A synthetase/AMP-(fatty) acid ligase
VTAKGVQAAHVWERIEAGLSRDPVTGLNTAQEACGRYAGERGRLALVVRHADGPSERWTYRELDRAAARAAALFHRAEPDRATGDGPLVETAAGDTATLLFTSATTGEPKACAMRTRRCSRCW